MKTYGASKYENGCSRGCCDGPLRKGGPSSNKSIKKAARKRARAKGRQETLTQEMV